MTWFVLRNEPVPYFDIDDFLVHECHQLSRLSGSSKTILIDQLLKLSHRISYLFHKSTCRHLTSIVEIVVKYITYKPRSLQ